MNLLTLVLVCVIIALSAGIVVMKNLLDKRKEVIKKLDRILTQLLRTESKCPSENKTEGEIEKPKTMPKYDIEIIPRLPATATGVPTNVKNYTGIDEYRFSANSIVMRRGDAEVIVIIDDVAEIIIDKV